MLSALRSWLLAIVGTALVCALVRALAPEGMGKKVISAVCGFALLGALMGARLPSVGDPLEDLEGFTREAEDFARRAQEEGRNQTRFIIEEKCEAYIWDKAAQLGLALTAVSVTAGWSAEGFWVPESCQIGAEPDAALAAAIASDLGIPRERQTWRTTDG